MAAAVQPGVEARLERPAARSEDSDQRDVVVYPGGGRQIRLACGRPTHEQERLVRQLNEYLRGLV